MTRLSVRPDVIIENRQLKQAIDEFLIKNPWAFKYIPGE
jgi:hypothetical protein